MASALRNCLVLVSAFLLCCTAAQSVDPPISATPDPRAQIRQLPRGLTIDETHARVVALARPVENGPNPLILPSKSRFPFHVTESGDSVRVEWYRVVHRRRVAPSSYEHHTFEPVVFQRGTLIGAGWPFLEAHYSSLDLDQEWFRRMYNFGWAQGDR